MKRVTVASLYAAWTFFVVVVAGTLMAVGLLESFWLAETPLEELEGEVRFLLGCVLALFWRASS